MIAQNVAFWLIAVPTGICALGVVGTRNIVHSALYLVGVLGGVAALYLLLVAEFVAWVQVLIYIGAVIVLLLFGIMLTRAPMRAGEDLNNNLYFWAAMSGAVFFGIVASALVEAFDGEQVPIGDADKALGIRTAGLTSTIGELVIREYVIAFEVVGMLLLAAVIGAVALARRD